MHKLDQHILTLLQKNADLTIQEISKLVHLSPTPCWQRIKKLKTKGYIDKTVAILNAKKIGLNATIFAFITIDNHNQEKLTQFFKVIVKMPEILECNRMSGSVDYLLKVIVKDIEHYDLFYKKLINAVPFLKVSSNFVIENIKQTTEIPITE